jgi:hypothetical protein
LGRTAGGPPQTAKGSGNSPLKKRGGAEGAGVVMKGAEGQTKMLMTLALTLSLMFSLPVS